MGQHRNGKLNSLSQRPQPEHHSVTKAREDVVSKARAWRDAREASIVASSDSVEAFHQATCAQDAAEAALDRAIDAYDRKRGAE
jgi:hypothetical protein